MDAELIILGSSAALPVPGRNTSSQLLRVGNSAFLIDCGEGALSSLRRIQCNPNQVNKVFISHLHGDHYFGLLPMLSTMHLQQRHSPLDIYADPRFKEVFTLVFGIAETKFSFPIRFHDLSYSKQEQISDEAGIEVSSFPLHHRIPTCGFTFKSKKAGWKYSYCSDTRFDKSYIDAIRNSSLLYHESTFLKDKQAQAHQKMHSTAQEAGKAARLSGAGQLIIGHFSARYPDVAPLLDEARMEFANTIAAKDLLRITL
jgi:ribonuclease Z